MFPLTVSAESRVEAVLGRKVTARWLREQELGRPLRIQVLEPQFVAAFEGAFPHADSPEVARAARRARREEMRARLDAALQIEVSDETIVVLVAEFVAIDQSVLDQPGRLRYVLLADTVSAWAQANAVRSLAAYVGPAGDPDGDAAAEARRDRRLLLEVRVARNISDDAAARDIVAARRLDSDLRPVRDAWSSGQVSFRHVAAFLDRTRLCSPELTTAVLDRIGDRLTSTPSTRIGTVINGALASIDPRGQADRARHARRHEVGVTQRTLPDGLGQITVIDKVEYTRAIIDRIDDDADKVLVHSQTCEPCAQDVPAEIGPARAAAFRGIFFADNGAHAHDDPTDTADRAGAVSAETQTSGRSSRRTSRRGELQVVIDLATLLGLAENPALLAGQPVPADLARELATDCGSLRRIVTDPVDGHLLDYGTRTYLPQALKTHIAARDGTCRAPGCNQPAARCELDHVDPFPHGPSSVGNTHVYCKRDHTIKTDGDLRILEHLADGTTRWRTRDGQIGVTPPRPCLPEAAPPPPPLPLDDEPCPF